MNLEDFKKLDFPDTPGIYIFRQKGEILYIGKATSLRDRVRSYFGDDLIRTRGRLLVDMMAQAATVEYEQADSVLEAFIRESELIKKHQPKYNTKEKDNKSFNYVVITKEDFPRVLVVRGRNLEQAGVIGGEGSLTPKEQREALGFEYSDVFGPYPFGAELREAMKLIRRIFPYRDKCIPYEGPRRTSAEIDEGGARLTRGEDGRGKPCFNRSIGLCPGVCTGEISKKDYGRIIHNIRFFFRGKKQKILSELKLQMKEHSKALEFEKAGEVKRTIQALTHIQDISMIKKDAEFGQAGGRSDQETSAKHRMRIEAYDIAHLSGKDMVGVMVVMEDGGFAKHQYKKFNIKTVKSSDDTGALREVLERRLNHDEWGIPSFIVIDGGKAQLAAAESVLEKRGIKADAIGLVSVVKDDRHKAREILRSSIFTGPSSSEDPVIFDDGDVISINQECHRFAIAFHKKKRSMNSGFGRRA